MNFEQNAFNKKKAFSLMELSIVALVIGILIAGIIQGVKMIDKAKLSAAKSLTNNSPILSIPNLILWLETSSDKSLIPAQVANNSNISQWNSLTIQDKYYALRTASPAVKYKESSPIGGLPSIYFNGSGGLTLSSTKSSSNYTQIKTPLCNVTWFIVSKPDSISSNGTLFYNNPVHGFGYIVNSGARTILMYSVNSRSSSVNLSTNPEIASYTYDTPTNYTWSPVRLYANGHNLFPTATIQCREPFPNGTYFQIAPSFSGYISEMIFYNRALKNKERQAVENYLSQKYSIKLNRN